ncbi:hypothetical protein [uncultured Mycobacterium sp.]
MSSVDEVGAFGVVSNKFQRPPVVLVCADIVVQASVHFGSGSPDSV